MKKLFLLAGLLLSVAVAGELADLHGRLATPPSQAESSCDREAPPGTTFAPGVNPCVLAPGEPAISEIGIERSACLGSCPVYTFIVSSDGSFRYRGESGVERLGFHSGTVDRGRLTQILRFAEEMGFLSLEDSYLSGVLDNPSVFIKVVQDGEIKVVMDEGGSGPATLWALEQLIDSLLETATWDPAPADYGY